MEQTIIEAMAYITAKFPIVAAVYAVATGAYMTFCAIAAITKTQKDDKIADKLKIFFSIPPKTK